MLNEFECVGPMQIPWQFTVEQSLVQRRKPVMEALAHVRTPRTRICIERSVCKGASLIISNGYQCMPRLPGVTSKLAYGDSVLSVVCGPQSVRPRTNSAKSWDVPGVIGLYRLPTSAVCVAISMAVRERRWWR